MAKKIVIYDKTPPIKYKILKTLFFKVIGKQRKGANKLFYLDDVWNNFKENRVFRKSVLLNHWEKYFSGEVEDPEKEKCRQLFGKNIVDKFVEGDTFVRYC